MMAESDMTGSKLVFIDIDGTLLMRIILCRSRQNGVCAGPSQRSQALHLYRSFRAENRTQHSGSWIRRCSFRSRRTGEYRQRTAVPAPRIARSH